MQAEANAETLKNILRYAEGQMSRRERKAFELSMMTDAEREAATNRSAIWRNVAIAAAFFSIGFVFNYFN